MDYAFIAAALQNQWNTWNIRGFMILSLCMQLLLAIFAPYRQHTSNRYLLFVVWAAYTLADWAAMFAFGLISNAGCWNLVNKGTEVPPDVLAFWAAFLLVHLGGPDNITAFSMEDNALWTRHLLGLIAQLSVFMYIFLKTLPNNRLMFPTALMFVAGVINYGERTRALYLASLDNLKQTTEKKATVQEQRKGSSIFHGILRGLVVDIVPDLQECNKSRAEILGYAPPDISRFISVEINLLYELLYTKIKAANSTWGKIVRAVTYYSTLVAFISVCSRHRHQFQGGDLVITYALFVGVFVLHAANTMTLMTSFYKYHTVMDSILLFLGMGIFAPLVVLALHVIASNLAAGSPFDRLFTRAWLKNMGSFNIMSHCFEQGTRYNGLKISSIWNTLNEKRHVSREDIDILLWVSLCEDIMENAKEPINATRMRELYEARGDQALRRISCDRLMPYIGDFQYEKTLLIWHIATEICINMNEEQNCIENDDEKRKRIFSKKLSDYMMYLLVRRPKLMSSVAGISHISYRDTCTDLKWLGSMSEVQTVQEFCNSTVWDCADLIKVKFHEFSVLRYSCSLAELLRETDTRWEIVYNVWVELLSYAAGHCRVESHARVLSEGGEFITVIWVLMSLCGIGDRFPVDRPTSCPP